MWKQILLSAALLNCSSPISNWLNSHFPTKIPFTGLFSWSFPPHCFLFPQTPVLAVVGNDACWSQISREQVPILGSNVACGLAFTGSYWRRAQNIRTKASSDSFYNLGGFAMNWRFFSFADYHVVADGYGGKGYLIGRKEEEQLRDIIRQAQEEAHKGRAVLLNVLIGKTNFREGSISV